MSQEDLLIKAMAGDRAAFADLLERAGREARQSLRGHIGREWQGLIEVEDVMQVTYLESVLAFDRREELPLRNLATWLVRIAQNNLRDAIRELEAAKRPDVRKRVAATAADSESCIELLEWIGCTTTTPSRDAAAREARQLVHQAIERLPAPYREAVRLFDIEGWPAGEACARLDCSEANLHMRRARARVHLRRLLGPGSRLFVGSTWAPAEVARRGRAPSDAV